MRRRDATALRLRTAFDSALLSALLQAEGRFETFAGLVELYAAEAARPDSRRRARVVLRAVNNLVRSWMASQISALGPGELERWRAALDGVAPRDGGRLLRKVLLPRRPPGDAPSGALRRA